MCRYTEKVSPKRKNCLLICDVETRYNSSDRTKRREKNDGKEWHMLQAIDYAKMGCDTLMKKYSPETLPPGKRLFYHQGVFLSGMERTYELCGEKKYFDYIKSYIDMFIDEDGKVLSPKKMFDETQPAVLMYTLMKETGDEKYKKAVNDVMSIYDTWPVNKEGGFWHAMKFPNQVWLDSLYMAGPLAVMYGKTFGEEKYFDLIHHQMKLMWEHMRDEETGLLYHAWDSSKEAPWADGATGCSAEFWGRALGWYVVTLTDMAQMLPTDYPKRNEFVQNAEILLKALIRFQDENTGLWYQVVNRGDDPRNWTETSCSCLFSYALAKALRLGMVAGKPYDEALERGYEGIVRTVRIENGDLFVDKVCVGTCVMSYEEYLARPVVTNDLHGMGAFVLMCSEYQKYINTKGRI